MVTINEIINAIETFSPLTYQEDYDNSGIQVGDIHHECKGVLLCLDITESVIHEAIAKKCNLIVAHHPLIFQGIKQLSGRNYVERCIILAIQHNICIYASHTNLDNHLEGVSARMAQKLGLTNTHILAPQKNSLYKLQTFVPQSHADAVLQAIFAAGAGHIGNYEECAFQTQGQGSFKPLSNSNPYIGQPGGERKEVNETKIEAIVPIHVLKQVQRALLQAHPYEEVAYDWIELKNTNNTIGSGIIGDLPQKVALKDALQLIKQSFNAPCIRHTSLDSAKKIQRIALCGGSGSFLLQAAIQQQADLFLTADFKYHQFFDADNQIVIADIGHYESEQYTVEIFSEIIKEKFPNFAVYYTSVNTNPINYYS